MDHAFIARYDLIDRYVRGTMAPADRFEFEEHFLDCRECLEQLEIARSLREGVKVCGAQPSAMGASQERPSRTSWFSWRPMPALAAAVLLVSTVPSIVLYRSLDNARTDLDREKRRGDSLANAPILPPAVYMLSTTRGVQATHTVKIPESSPWILLLLEVDVSEYREYRAVLKDGAGKTVWTSGKLDAAGPDSMGLTLPSQVLRAGDYVLGLEGRSGDGGYVAVASFPLRAVGGN
jgi:hypothetical protein